MATSTRKRTPLKRILRVLLMRWVRLLFGYTRNRLVRAVNQFLHDPLIFQPDRETTLYFELVYYKKTSHFFWIDVFIAFKLSKGIPEAPSLRISPNRYEYKAELPTIEARGYGQVFYFAFCPFWSIRKNLSELQAFVNDEYVSHDDVVKEFSPITE